MESEHVQGFKASETLLTNARHSFCDIFWLFRQKISSKIYVLVVSEILSMFVYILKPDDKYSLWTKAGV